MPVTNRLTPSALVLALAVGVLGACGDRANPGDRPQAGGSSARSSGGTPPKCLTAGDVSAAVGLEVREFREGTQTSGDNVVCAYQVTDAKLGAFVTTVVGPAEQSDEVFRDMKEAVKGFLGTKAEPEAIQVGERGYAYGSMSKSEAAAVSGGRLYHAEVVSSASANIGDKRAAMIAIIQKLMGR